MKRAPLITVTILLSMLLGYLLPASANADERVKPIADPIAYTADEIRDLGLDISKQLRCPKSVNQNLLDSQAPIASELKAQIFLMLNQGHSEEDIITFMVERYGEKIRYMPSLSSGTSLLWLAPLLLVLLAILSVFFFIRPKMVNRADQVEISQIDGTKS
ncbi:cytochrome c-type biogenesis protein CcmH [Shewanella eurypsychrophilus]|uniref:Cytochrome c-type biogenesis protein n=1 Tax=Shewanella eurypsychrophilus TaxID=2593656 RepID=A0ABX6VB39_9GAMM|nr:MULTISPECIES: cytochrome c-type biogenesis protein CcmH [Shewanella]QFU24699.1 cytochrome c-type biogenesis protein CcmH [Shewanella sp. YLB-09]QPG59891.1 cytochrome c-type biogenesis protein CcmH [Shewanella eurypsychrophilus]